MTTPISILLAIADEHKLSGDAFPRALSSLKVKNAKAQAQPQKIADGGGLTLYIPGTGAKSWRYRFRLNGKEQTLTLGGYPEISLDTARKAHRAARWLVERGQSPISYAQGEIERSKVEELAKTKGSFGAVAAQWLIATKKSVGSETNQNRTSMLERYVLSELMDVNIRDVSRKSLMELLSKIDNEYPVTAKVCRSYISQIFEYALDYELVQWNPTPSSKVLINYLSRKVVHRKALPLGRLGVFLKTLNTAPKTDLRTKAAMKLVILTWTRTSEVIQAEWAEFDLSAGIWIIPAERMKAKEDHKVFLSSQAIAILTEHRKVFSGQYVFPNQRNAKRPMSRTTLYSWRDRWGFKEEMDVHGFRATASTWANESGHYRPDVIEVALAHREGDRVRAAYNRAEFAKELRKLWQDWGDLCEQLNRP